MVILPNDYLKKMQTIIRFISLKKIIPFSSQRQAHQRLYLTTQLKPSQQGGGLGSGWSGPHICPFPRQFPVSAANINCQYNLTRIYCVKTLSKHRIEWLCLINVILPFLKSQQIFFFPAFDLQNASFRSQQL